MKILHLAEIGICRCTAHHDGVQDGARIKSIPPTRSDLLSQKKGLILLIMTSKKNSPNKKGYIGFVGSQPMLLLLHQYLGKHQKAIT